MGLPILEREMKMKHFGLPKIWYESARIPYTY